MANARIKHKRDTTVNWDAARGFIPLAGEIIIYTDYRTVTTQIEEGGTVSTKTTVIPGIKIGDGLAYVQDLPFVNDEDLRNKLLAHISDTDVHITPEERTFWNNKINVDDSYDILYGELVDETLVLTRN